MSWVLGLPSLGRLTRQPHIPKLLCRTHSVLIYPIKVLMGNGPEVKDRDSLARPWGSVTARALPANLSLPLLDTLGHLLICHPYWSVSWSGPLWICWEAETLPDSSTRQCVQLNKDWPPSDCPYLTSPENLPISHICFQFWHHFNMKYCGPFSVYQLCTKNNCPSVERRVLGVNIYFDGIPWLGCFCGPS